MRANTMTMEYRILQFIDEHDGLVWTKLIYNRLFPNDNMPEVRLAIERLIDEKLVIYEGISRKFIGLTSAGFRNVRKN